MAILFPQQPRIWEATAYVRWFEILWNYVRPTVQLVADASEEIGSGTTYVGVTTLTASRTLTLPLASAVQDGDEIIVQDESSVAGTYSVVIQTAGADTINGGSSVSITANFGRRTIVKRGAGKWFSA